MVGFDCPRSQLCAVMLSRLLVCVMMLIPAGSRCLGNAPNAAHVHAAFQTVVLRCVSLSIHGSVSGCAVRAETCVCCFRLSLLATCLLFRLRTSARWRIFKRASCGSPTSASRIQFPNQCVRISRSVCLDVFVANVAPGDAGWAVSLGSFMVAVISSRWFVYVWTR